MVFSGRPQCVMNVLVVEAGPGAEQDRFVAQWVCVGWVPWKPPPRSGTGSGPQSPPPLLQSSLLSERGSLNCRLFIFEFTYGPLPFLLPSVYLCAVQAVDRCLQSKGPPHKGGDLGGVKNPRWEEHGIWLSLLFCSSCWLPMPVFIKSPEVSEWRSSFIVHLLVETVLWKDLSSHPLFTQCTSHRGRSWTGELFCFLVLQIMKLFSVIFWDWPVCCKMSLWTYICRHIWWV